MATITSDVAGSASAAAENPSQRWKQVSPADYHYKIVLVVATALLLFYVTMLLANAALAESNPPLIAAETDVLDSDWTVVAMDFDGAWGVGTAISTNLAISIAFSNCKKMSKKEIGCGAHSRTMRSGWILALQCGSESILVAHTKLEDAENAAIAREIELRQVYARDMPACKRVLAVDPRGVVVRENFEISRRVPITEPTRITSSEHQP
jgi:hypothetical protein